MDDRVTILISTPDSYRDVLNIFIQCYKKYWPDCPFPLLISAQTQDCLEFKTIKTDDALDSWCDRTRFALQFINTKYVLVICDDYFFTSKIDNKEIFSVIDDLEKYNISFCGLSNHLKGPKFEKKSLLIKVKQNQSYAKSLNVGFFKRDYLQSILSDKSLSAYDLEKKWLVEAEESPNVFFEDVASCKKNLLHGIEGVGEGVFNPYALKWLRSNSIDINSNRGVMNSFKALIFKLRKRIGKKIRPKTRRRIKKILQKIGFRFVTEN